MSDPRETDRFKRLAALAAVNFIQDGMMVGLGTGSTARHVILALGEAVKKGLRIKGIPTSLGIAELATQAGIPLLENQDAWAIDVAIDGADQVDPHLNLMKGGGGALLKEKIVAAAAKQLVIVVDHSKRVQVLGDPLPLPIEVMPFGWGNTASQIETLGGKAVARQQGGQFFTTEGGHYILDWRIDRIEDPGALERQLNVIPGVVETGLFVGRTSVLVVGTPQGIDIQEAGGNRESL